MTTSDKAPPVLEQTPHKTSDPKTIARSKKWYANMTVERKARYKQLKKVNDKKRYDKKMAQRVESSRGLP